MRYFSVPTNYDPELIEKISKYNVFEIYGKLAHDVIGGGRPPIVLKDISRKRLEQEVISAHTHGLEFNYLLNASCLDNIEYTAKGYKQIKKFLGFLSEIKIDTITVTIPYLFKIIKENFPKFKISVSTLAGVDNVKKYDLWQELGVNSITMAVNANRNFELLSYLTKNRKTEIKLMLNQACERECIYYNYHTNVISHQSKKANALPLEFCSFNCKYRRTKDPSLLLQSPWIRPEDLKYYEKIGVHKFKVIQRQDPTERILRATKAYAEGSYKGNLLDIINFVYNINIKSLLKFDLARYKKLFFSFIKPQEISLFKLISFIKNINDDYGLYIDNQKLDGFIEKFYLHKCVNRECSSCAHCAKWTKKAVSYDTTKRKILIKKYETILNYFYGKKNIFYSGR